MDVDPKPRMARRLKIVLGLSLALNLLFVGLIAGAAYRHGGKGGPAGASLQGYAAPYMRALPREKRRAFRHAMQQGDALPDRAVRRGFYTDVLAGLRADRFDAGAVAAAMTRQREVVVGVQEAAQAAWVTLVSQMSRAERLAYAEALEERLKHGHRRRGSGKEGH